MAQIAADKTNGSEPREAQEETQCQKCGGHGVVEVIMPDCLGAEAATVERPCPKCSGKVSHIVDANNMGDDEGLSVHDRVHHEMKSLFSDFWTNVQSHLDDVLSDDEKEIKDAVSVLRTDVIALISRERERAEKAGRVPVIKIVTKQADKHREELAAYKEGIDRLKAELEWERKVWPDEISAAIGLNADSVGRTPSMCAAAVKSEIDRLKAELEWERKVWPDEISAAIGLNADSVGRTPSMCAAAVKSEIDRLKAVISDLEKPIKRHTGKGCGWTVNGAFLRRVRENNDSPLNIGIEQIEAIILALVKMGYLELEAPPVLPEGCAS